MYWSGRFVPENILVDRVHMAQLDPSSWKFWHCQENNSLWGTDRVQERCVHWKLDTDTSRDFLDAESQGGNMFPARPSPMEPTICVAAFLHILHDDDPQRAPISFVERNKLWQTRNGRNGFGSSSSECPEKEAPLRSRETSSSGTISILL
jgi:hypothetical protein